MFKGPLIASALVHATVVAATIVGGHGLTSSSSARAPLDVPIALEVMVAESEVAAPLRVNDTEPRATAQPRPPSHTHDYPVPPDHDRPHDPSLVHEHAEPQSRASEAGDVVALPAAGPVAAPVFTIVVGPAIAPQGGPAAAHASAGTTERSEPMPEASVSVPAHLLASAPPAYPPAARAAEVEADVVLEIVLDGEGRVSDARVTRAAGYGLDTSALEAIRGYRFSPAQKDGHPVRVRMHWTVQFRLR